MRKVQFYGAVSIDGYLAAKDHDLQWLFDTEGGEKAGTELFLEQIDVAVMGRKTYEESKKMIGEAVLNPGLQNVVFSSAKSESTEDAVYCNEDLVSHIRDLKQKDGKHIWIVGGSGIVLDLLKADLIDEWFIQIAPVLLGDGIRLFENGVYFQRLKLVETTSYDQLAELHYVRRSPKG